MKLSALSARSIVLKLLMITTILLSLPVFAVEGGQGFVGMNFGVGQGFASKPGSPGVAFDMAVEPGYAIPLGSWARAEASLEAGYGSASYRASSDSQLGEKMTFSMVGFMPKLGYGYSLGDGLFAVWRVGVGPMALKYTGKDRNGNSFSGNTTAVGLRTQFDLVLPATSFVDFTAGVKVTHLSGDLGEADLTAGSTTAKTDLGSLNMNLLEGVLGMRLKF